MLGSAVWRKSTSNRGMDFIIPERFLKPKLRLSKSGCFLTSRLPSSPINTHSSSPERSDTESEMRVMTSSGMFLSGSFGFGAVSGFALVFSAGFAFDFSATGTLSLITSM